MAEPDVDRGFFDVSLPIRIICSTDGLLCTRSSTTPFWHIDAVREAVHPTGLHLRGYGIDRFWKAFEAVDDGDQDVGDAKVHARLPGLVARLRKVPIGLHVVADMEGKEHIKSASDLILLEEGHRQTTNASIS
ncbi:hypothetical protein X743_33545 [Mesorhizobium sp. LNHC252B00]|nr:hypothetical protein X743_33545 [Mesorhizobium sp. LNHC252B00]